MPRGESKPENVFSRRGLITAGAASALGLSLPELLAAESLSELTGRARSVVLLYLFGGPPKHELFDPKPNASEQIRGPFGVIDTDLPGVQFSELVPKMSRWLHKSTLVRSATHPHNDHSAGLLYTMAGKKARKLESAVPTLPTQAPCTAALTTTKIVKPTPTRAGYLSRDNTITEGHRRSSLVLSRPERRIDRRKHIVDDPLGGT